MSRGRRPMNKGAGNRGPSNMISPFRGSVGHISPFSNNLESPSSKDNLQLRELDLELALLKRKREIIEKQQQMLTNDQFGQSSRYNFNETQSFNRQQYDNNPTRNFSHFYDSPGPLIGSLDRQQGTKRQAEDNSWQNSGPKRFSGGSMPRNRPRNRTGPNQPRPLMGTNWPRPSNKPIPKSRSDFNPTKVSKPKTSSNSAVNKLKSYPVEELKTIVSEASSLVQPKPELDLVLHADKPLSKQVSGRLELALGSIFKEVMESRGDDTTHVPFHTLRDIKQAIRERIRTVMTGKLVGTAADVRIAYREAYDKDSDRDIVKQALDAHTKTARNFAKDKVLTKRVPDNPTKYFKIKLNRLLHATLADMFSQMTQLYEVNKNSEDVNKILEEMKAADDKVAKASESLEKDIANQTNEILAIETDENVTKESNGDVSKENGTPETIVIDGNESQKEDGSAKLPEEDISKCSTDKLEETVDSLNESANIANEDGEGLSTRYKAQFYDRLITALLQQRLPYILPKYKEKLTTLISVNKEYLAARNALLASNGEADASLVEAEAAEIAEEKALPRRFPYFVKVMGRPSLPKRNVMQAFLNKFKPCSIKKHRNIHNLLFVSFNDKEDFDAILAENEIVVGGSSIEIKLGDKSSKDTAENKEPPQTDFSDDVIIVERPAQVITLDEADHQETVTETQNTQQETVNQQIVAETENTQKEMEVLEQVPEEPNEYPDNVDEWADVVENIKEDSAQNIEEPKEDATAAKNGDVEGAIETARSTRASARLAGSATPKTVQTRRTSKIAQNN